MTPFFRLISLSLFRSLSLFKLRFSSFNLFLKKRSEKIPRKGGKRREEKGEKGEKGRRGRKGRKEERGERGRKGRRERKGKKGEEERGEEKIAKKKKTVFLFGEHVDSFFFHFQTFQRTKMKRPLKPLWSTFL